MPLSKKRNRERRVRAVQPSSWDIVVPIDVTFPVDEQDVIILDHRIVQPIPNCPDGRHRDATE